MSQTWACQTVTTDQGTDDQQMPAMSSGQASSYQQVPTSPVPGLPFTYKQQKLMYETMGTTGCRPPAECYAPKKTSHRRVK